MVLINEAVCFGDDTKGQVTILNAYKTNVKLISAGNLHTCVKKNGKASKCFGDNSSGQTNIPTNFYKFNFDYISLGKDYTCIGSNNKYKCFGGNHYGQTQIEPE